MVLKTVWAAQVALSPEVDDDELSPFCAEADADVESVDEPDDNESAFCTEATSADAGGGSVDESDKAEIARG